MTSPCSVCCSYTLLSPGHNLNHTSHNEDETCQYMYIWLRIYIVVIDSHCVLQVLWYHLRSQLAVVMMEPDKL